MKLSWVLLLCLSTCTPALAGGQSPHADDGEDYYVPQGSFGFMDDVPITLEGSEYVQAATEPEGATYFIRVVPAEEHFADVLFQNQLVSRYFVSDEVTLTFEGFEIRTSVDAGAGDAPDTLVVYPPPGYYTIPESITLEEGEMGVIEIHQLAML